MQTKYHNAPALFIFETFCCLFVETLLVILNSTELTDEFNKNWHKIAPFALGYQEGEDSNMEATNDIRRYYFGTNPVGLETRDNLTNMFSDRNFFQCTKNAALLHARFSPVHMYYFTQVSVRFF